MKFKIGDHLQEISYRFHGYVVDIVKYHHDCTWWYLIENDEMNLVNCWVPERSLELHKETLREIKLKELGIV